MSMNSVVHTKLHIEAVKKNQKKTHVTLSDELCIWFKYRHKSWIEPNLLN